MNFLASPELVTAMSYSGSTTFNPMTDSITTPTGESFRFQPPVGQDLPSLGFASGNPLFAPATVKPDPTAEVKVSPTSTRLALLEPFDSWPSDADGAPSELSSQKVLLKVKGQCTTDTISAAGPWLKFKGHLPNIAENTLIGAVNAETGATNQALDVDGTAYTIPDLAKKWKSESQPWIVVAEHNYGEGSAREHAALQPRYLGARLIVAKSFARIHETNLKKQGVVPLTFVNEADYDKISGCDEVATEGLAQALKTGAEGGDISSSAVSLVVKKSDGTEVKVPLKHALSKDQCGFVLAGSALNLLAKRNQSS
jgi:homoaconitase